MKAQTNLKLRRPSSKKRNGGNDLWHGYYDVVIVPPSAIQNSAIALSKKLRGSWQLSRNRFIPHISLYHIPVHDKHFDAFVAAIKSVVSGTEAGELEVNGFDMPVLTVSKPTWLDQLQRRIVRGTLPYFDRDHGAEETWSLDFFKGRRRRYAEQYLKVYGTPMFGMNFRPHITLTSFRGRQVPTDFSPIVKKRCFVPTQVTICELGRSHSCQRVVERIEFTRSR